MIFINGKFFTLDTEGLQMERIHSYSDPALVPTYLSNKKVPAVLVLSSPLEAARG